MIIFSLLMLIGLSPLAFATQDDPTLSGKGVIERLARLEEGQKVLNKRIDDLGKRIDDLRGLIYVVLAGIIALIGFVIWDRRTALSPVISKTKELEEREDLTLRVLKEYARKEPRMAEVLRTLGML